MDESQAPGCYGSALTFDMGSAECSQCMFAAQCGPKSVERMNYLREKLRLPETKSRKKVDKPAAVSNTAAEMTIPVKVQALMNRIEQAGIKVTECLREGRNPFKKPEFLAMTCKILLAVKQVEHKRLVQAFQTHLGWSEGTATAHATQVRQLLVHLGAATYDNGILRLK